MATRLDKVVAARLDDGTFVVSGLLGTALDLMKTDNKTTAEAFLVAVKAEAELAQAIITNKVGA